MGMKVRYPLFIRSEEETGETITSIIISITLLLGN